MNYQYIPYIWLLIASAFTSLFLGMYALIKRRDSKCSGSFIISMFIVTIWSGGNALEMAGSDLQTKIFWANVQYFAYCYSPVALLALSMQFTGYDKWIQNRKILWAALLPTIIIILVWTDVWHGLIRYDMHMDYSGYFPVISKKYGPVFYIHGIYSHILNLTAWGLLLRAVFFKNSVYRKQAVSLFLGVSLIVIPNILYISGLSPVKKIDITPLFFGPAGLIIAWSIFYFKFLDLIPIARAKAFETMAAGVMVLDLQDRILDNNPAFAALVGLPASKVSAGRVEEVCSKIPELNRACLDRTVTYTEFSITSDEKTKFYEVFLSPLTDNKCILIGRLVVIYETTEKKRAQQEFLKQQWKDAVIEERERIARNLHDDLGQILGFIGFQAQGIKHELTDAGVEIVSQELDKLILAAKSANNDIREYIHNARSEKAADQDFITALRQHMLNFERDTGIKAELKNPFCFKWDHVNTNTKINTLNIIKEALNNIRKHSQAKNAAVSFFSAGDHLCIAIEDNGNGFVVDCHDDTCKTNFGLSIMCERAFEIGGQIVIESIIGKGSKVSLYLPVREGCEADEGNAG